MKLFLYLLGVAIAGFLVVGAGVESYKLDLKTPADLVFTHPYGPPLPDKVDVYRTGPQVGTDKRETHVSLSRRTPDYSVSNRVEIKELVSALRNNDNKARVSNATTREGYTYHLLLFNEESKTVMHFRALEFTETNTIWSSIRPRSDTSFVYFNTEIVPWLKAHAKFATNEPPTSPKMPEPTNSTPRSNQELTD